MICGSIHDTNLLRLLEILRMVHGNNLPSAQRSFSDGCVWSAFRLRILRAHEQPSAVGVLRMNETRETTKQAVKEAAKEFMREKWTEVTSTVGKWALGMIAAAIVAALVYLIMWANGWRQP